VANVNYQGEASDTTINSGGSETVSAGGFDSAATISGGGSLTVLGGITRSATIDSGGSLTVSGGVASATTINSGGVETVLSGGSATSTTINGSGAVLDLLSGAVVSGGIAFVGSGGQLQIAGTPPTSASAISGFTASGDFIDLTSLAFSGTTSVGFSSAADMLTVIEGGGSATVQLDSENYTGISWVAQSDGVSGTDIAAACYCRGTLILTDRGEVPVEDLAIGDKVATISCEAKPIRWIGRRSYAARFVAGNRAVLPVRVAAGAIGEGVPARDLFVSPEHALFIPGSSPGTGVLVPARQLVNGASIVQTEAVEQIDYFNIELEAHDIIFAEAMPAESYVDCDNRYMFQNASEFAALYPGDDRPAWQFCAKRLEEGSAALPAIRAALLARAEALGYRRTGDPDLHLIVDGEIVRAQAVENGTCRFTIPAGSGAVSLASRSAVPAEVEAGSHDRRRLGVPLQAIFLREAGLCTEIGHGHPSLREGFHDDEDGHRWTDGCARLPDELLRPFAGEVGLEVRLIKPGLRYPLEAAAAPARIRRPPAARG
jgi:autotransporter passenger strand-loop-strand repeat protein